MKNDRKDPFFTDLTDRGHYTMKSKWTLMLGALCLVSASVLAQETGASIDTPKKHDIKRWNIFVLKLGISIWTLPSRYRGVRLKMRCRRWKTGCRQWHLCGTPCKPSDIFAYQKSFDARQVFFRTIPYAWRWRKKWQSLLKTEKWTYSATISTCPYN